MSCLPCADAALGKACCAQEPWCLSPATHSMRLLFVIRHGISMRSEQVCDLFTRKEEAVWCR